MSVVGGGNLYPNWLGTASLSIPNNQIVVNGKTVNVVPIVDLTNHSISSVTANVKTLVWTLPGTYAAGVYAICGEFLVTNTGGGNTPFAAGDGVDWIIQGIGDPTPDYAEASIQPYYSSVAVTGGSGQTTSVGTCRLAPSAYTQISADNTQIGVYVRYTTTGSGTVTATFLVGNLSIQKVA